MSRKLTRLSYNFETRIKSKLYGEAIAWGNTRTSAQELIEYRMKMPEVNADG